MDRVDVDQTPRGDRGRDYEHEPAHVPQSRDDRAADEVRGDRLEVVAQCVHDRPVRRVPVEDVLRNQRVDKDDRGERKCERVGKQRTKRQPPSSYGIGEDSGECDDQQDVLPGLNRGQRVPANSRSVQSVHHRVVQCETDEEHIQRDDRSSPHDNGCDAERERVDDERGGRHFASRRNRSRL